MNTVTSKRETDFSKITKIDDLISYLNDSTKRLENRVFLSSVAYSNCDNPDGKEKLTWSNATNTNIKNATHIAELTGYVKDSAWDYEREIRIKAVLKSGHNCSRVAIEIPDEVLDSITVVAGPLFHGTLETRLNDEIKRRKIELKQSLFFEKLNIDSGCSVCQYRNNGGQYENKN